MSDAENARLLKLLEENGQAFLNSFHLVNANKKRKNELEKSESPSNKKAKKEGRHFEEEEWSGIVQNSSSLSDNDKEEGSGESSRWI